MRKSTIVAIIVAVIICAGAIMGYTYLNSTKSLKVNFKNVHSVEVFDISERQDSGKDKKLASITNSGDEVRLDKNKSYQVEYKGDDGYKDDFTTVGTDDSTINIDPEYSDAKYKSMMSAALPTVSAILRQSYPSVDSLYTIEPGGMKNKGEWFVVKLVYKGEYDFNTDTLRVLLRQKDNKWTMATKPEILPVTINYPDVEQSVLSWANTV